MSKKSKRNRNHTGFQKFVKITTDVWDSYLRTITNLPLELVGGGSLLYPNIALFVQTNSHYILELFGSSEVYKGLSVKTHEEPNINKYLYQFELKKDDESPRCHIDLCVKMERKQVGRERRHARSVQII